MQQFQVLLKVVTAFKKKRSTQEVFIKPAIHLEVSQYCILSSICLCVTNLCLLICIYLFTHVAICHWHYFHLVKASTLEIVSILEMAYNF
jgi:hypothetical protein